ncbi:MAG: U32 family peptidase C-terminal domain-containing protein [bacterium]
MQPELLSPAGDLEKLQTAVRFGADAVYVGAGDYSLRTADTSFNLEQLEQGIKLAHEQKVKVYLALNIFAFDNDLPKMMKYLKQAVKLGIDAVIVSDPGVINLIKAKKLKVKIHLSTQANTLNSEAVKFWQKQGVKRIVLGRELTLKQVKVIKKAVPKMEIELFVHGAMCMSYSGRCLLSKYMTGRSANRGECTHPCRWEYFMKEKERPEEEFSIEEDARGTYVMNSKDLCMIEHVAALKKAGVDSFKLEGRMKSAYYVAVVTKIYREALVNKKYDPQWLTELKKVSHRTYSTGFYLGEDDRENQESSKYVRDYAFVGVTGKCDLKEGLLEVFVRNNIRLGDNLEVVDPGVKEIKVIGVAKIINGAGEELPQAHNENHVWLELKLTKAASPHSLLRKALRGS